jgi:Predicted signal transduction protein with a C-terminal ATPase domain
MIPLVFFIILLFVMFGLYMGRYAELTHNVNVSSKFSLDFRDSMDLKMYHYSVNSKEQVKLPIEDVESAMQLARSLKKTTYRKESRRSIQNILDYCDNLKNKMYMLANTDDYDSRNLQLENNIYVLTNLIQEKMIDYMYYEAGYMAELEAKMLEKIKMIILIAFILVVNSITLLLYRAFRFSKGITDPIIALCENVNRVGNGEFSIPQVESDDYEIAQLNAGIQKMANRISLLLESVKKEEKLQHMTQIQLLQAQVNPHFLYNTLDTIVWLVESEQYEQTINMLSNLSLFFRTSLSKGKDVIRLEEEILHTRSYLEIQLVRYYDILDYEIELPENLKKIRVPKLTLQPLAENALYHGVKEKRGKSKIYISCMEQGDDILLTVSDNGIGIPPERLKEIQQSLNEGERIGFGLSAVHERVQLYCGEGYGIQISSEFEKGTTVQVLFSKNI